MQPAAISGIRVIPDNATDSHCSPACVSKCSARLQHSGSVSNAVAGYCILSFAFLAPNARSQCCNTAVAVPDCSPASVQQYPGRVQQDSEVCSLRKTTSSICLQRLHHCRQLCTSSPKASICHGAFKREHVCSHSCWLQVIRVPAIFIAHAETPASTKTSTRVPSKVRQTTMSSTHFSVGCTICQVVRFEVTKGSILSIRSIPFAGLANGAAYRSQASQLHNHT